MQNSAITPISFSRILESFLVDAPHAIALENGRSNLRLCQRHDIPFLAKANARCIYGPTNAMPSAGCLMPS
jgi:hypothetical protein